MSAVLAIALCLHFNAPPYMFVVALVCLAIDSETL
jgi:hypothetical protein